MREGLIPLALMVIYACSASTDPGTPASPSSIAERDANQRVADFIEKEAPGKGELMLQTGRVDLDGDGVDEILAYAAGPTRCGTSGCDLMVLKDDGNTLSKVSEISVAQLPVGVLDSKTNGMRDLAVTVYGVGQPQATMKVPFDGTSYAADPTVAPAVAISDSGTEVIADQPLDRMD